MKTEEELFNKYASNGLWCKILHWPAYRKSLKEHDKEIIELIDDMVLKRIKRIEPYFSDDVVGILTELKGRIKDKK